MGIAELRRSVEQPGGETVRTVPLLERNDRQRQQATRLSGVETEAKALNRLRACIRPLKAFLGPLGLQLNLLGPPL